MVYYQNVQVCYKPKHYGDDDDDNSDVDDKDFNDVDCDDTL